MSNHAWLRAAFIGVIAAAAAACGGSGGSTLSPSNLPTVTALSMTTVNPPGVGATVTASGSATLSNGTTVAISQGYTSDTPAVATVTAAGVMTGVSIGDVTISLNYQGFGASKKVRVLPSYGGIFNGSYTIDTCTDTGGFVSEGLCGTIPAGAVPPIAMNNAQSAELTSLTGQFLLGGLLGNSTGTVAANGALTYAGTVVAGATTVAFRNFAATSPAVGQIAGRFELVWTDTTVTGSSVWVCTIQTMNRTSGGVFETSSPSRTTSPPASSLRERVAQALTPTRR